MGTSHSTRLPSEDEHQEPEEEEEEEDDDDDDDIHHHPHSHHNNIPDAVIDHAHLKKILQQEPEMLPCHASASPLSPQLSTYSTPRMGPSIKVWDPYNVLAPPPSLPHFHRSFSPHPPLTDLYLITHGESHISLTPDLIAGRSPDSALTPNGKRQARALAVFLKSQGVRFNAVYSSPLDRARSTVQSVCQELNFSEDHVQYADALIEMSQGHWEGCHSSEIFTPETLSLMEKFQPDFSAPSGESLRQVEFRMLQFLHDTVMAFPHKLRSDFCPPEPNENPAFPNHSSHTVESLVNDQDGPSLVPSHWELLQRNRQGLARKKSGKSRLQIVTSTGDHEADDEMSPRPPVGDINGNMRSIPSSVSSCIGIFTHSTPIKCLVTGLLGCSPAMTPKICIDDSSVTVLQHSWKAGWQIKRLNDTSHLRLL